MKYWRIILTKTVLRSAGIGRRIASSRRSSRISRRTGSGGRSEAGFDVFAPRDDLSEQTRPLGGHFLVEAVEYEDEGSLEWSGDREEYIENNDDVLLWYQVLKVTEYPRETDRDVYGDVHPEFLLPVPLVRFRGSRECLVDLSADEEEEDTV